MAEYGLHIKNMKKYSIWYNSIISRRLQNPVSDTVYSERHHIVPESFYIQRSREGPPGWLHGNPEDPSNIISLSAREHFVCHWLLVKMTTGIGHTKMRDALEMMSVDSGNQDRYSTRITSRVFERNRIEVAKIRSERMTGDSNPMNNEESRKRVGESKIGVKREPFSKEWLDNMAASHTGELNGMWGKSHSEGTKAVLSKLATGRKQSPETVKKKADAVRGHKKPLKHCEHCNRDIAVNGYVRFHGDKCKMKQK